MLRAFRIPPLALLVTVMALAAGELACGTGLYFVTMMCVAMLSIGLTYNVLGGLATIGGAAFAVLALRLIVISQFAKVVLFQRADSYIEAPSLTITVYAVFFLAAAAGAFVFSHFRLSLPHPLEPETSARSMRLYAIALPLGVAGVVLFNLTTGVYGRQAQTQFDLAHSLGVGLGPMLLFALIIAVDLKIRRTEGRHSFGLLAFVPWLVSTLAGVVDSQRESIMAASVIYFVTCYFRGYRFRLRHYVAAAAGVVLFVLVISPVALLMRNHIGGLTLRERIAESESLLSSGGTLAQAEVAANSSFGPGGGAEDYYGLPGLEILSRFSRIRMDSNLIRACRHYHYGFTALDLDLESEIPHFLDRNKPLFGSGDFLGRVSGVSAGVAGVSEPAFTMVGDTFGGFGFLGLVIVGIFVLPFTLKAYDCMFEVGRPWGTIAAIMIILPIAEGGLGRLVAVILIRTSIYLIAGSWLIAILAGNFGSVRRGSPGVLVQSSRESESV